jgi:hypothetical protein
LSLATIWKLLLKTTFCSSVPKRIKLSQSNLNSQSKMRQVEKRPIMRVFTVFNCIVLLWENFFCSKVYMFARHNLISSLWLKTSLLLMCSTSLSWSLMGPIWYLCCLLTVDLWLICLMKRIQVSFPVISLSSTGTKLARTVSTMESNTTISQP